jgi:uncharacterized protein with PIN domain
MTVITGAEAIETRLHWEEIGVLELKPKQKTCPTCQTELPSLQNLSGAEALQGAVGVFELTLYECQTCQQRYYTYLTIIGLG